MSDSGEMANKHRIEEDEQCSQASARKRPKSCSKTQPCDRCIRSGTSASCTYASRPRGPTATPVSAEAKDTFIPFESPFASYGLEARQSNANQNSARPVLKDAARDHERIQKLELEIAQLKNILAKQSQVEGSTTVASPATTRDMAKDTPPTYHPAAIFMDDEHCWRKAMEVTMNYNSRYYGPHNPWSSLKELTGITHFMKETAEEWLQPLNIQKKDREMGKQDRDMKAAKSNPTLESLLPSKEETDPLVTVYLDQFEQLYRIVHIPMFRKEYKSFWDPNPTRPASLTALILSMISVSCCLDMQGSNEYIGLKSSAYALAETWINACDEWLSRQSLEHRKLVHYQIECLLFLARKVNIIKKKRFWLLSGDLVCDAVCIGLHEDPDSIGVPISPYNKEMRRRIWATIVEFDLQASFDLGVPTMLGYIHNDTDAPMNIDDDSFDEDSTELPITRPRTEYTLSSYAHFSRQSLPVRLELCKILTGPPIDLDWKQVLHYSDMITQEIDALPPWDLDSDQISGVSHKPSLAHTLLHIQLRQFLIPLHQPFLKQRKNHSKYQIAEFIYYTAARDIILMHDRLFQKGIRTLYFLRGDPINAAMNLCNISLLQPKGSTSLIASNSRETLDLIEKCITLKEDRILRCGNNEPWGYSSMCAAYGLIETHLGLETRQAAKAHAAERFIHLHCKLLDYQVPAVGLQQMQPDGIRPQSGLNASTSVDPHPAGAPLSPMQLGDTPGPLSKPPADSIQLLIPKTQSVSELLGSDLNELWGDWSAVDIV